MKRALVVLLLLLALPLAAQQEPGQKRGFAPDKVFDASSGLDTVNTFNGNLSVQIPLGAPFPVSRTLSYALGLSYNSKVWDYEEVGTYVRAIPNRRSNAGLGWLVSLGRIIPPTNSTNEAGSWVYESPDGGDHVFFLSLHPDTGQTPALGVVKRTWYTRDGSYLRLTERDENGDTVVDALRVESPDGVYRTFNTSGQLTSISDRFNNRVTVEHLTSITGTPCVAGDTFAWRINDTQGGRTNYVCFKPQPYFDSTWPGQIERIVLGAPPDPVTGAARTATYVFNYLLRDIRRGCWATYPNDDPTVFDVPMLYSITLPDNSQYNFSYYENSPKACETGSLYLYQVPTGATVYYTYRYWTIPVEACGGSGPWWTKNYPGIDTRNVTGPRLTAGTTTYVSHYSSHPEWTICGEDDRGLTRPIPSEQLTVTVTDPAGNVSEHFYSVWPMTAEVQWDANGVQLPFTGNSPRGFRKDEYGLPFTRRPGTESGSSLLSSRVYTAAGWAANPKVPLRSTYVIYGRDNTSCSSLDETCLNANKRILAERTIYHDDNNRVAHTAYSDYDGLGNMRSTALSGGFTGGNVTSYVAFNKRHAEVNPAVAGDGVIDSGTYPGSFTMPTLSHAWILNTASYRTVTDGAVTATVQTCHAPATGFLRAQRMLRNATRAANDLYTVFTADAYGNLAAETYGGGDVKQSAPTTGTLCASAGALPAYDYQLTHTYDVGVRKTSRYTGASFDLWNASVHRPTGMILSETDPAGRITYYGYDRMLRIARVAPPAMAATTYTYVNATNVNNAATFTPARVEAKTISAQGAGTVETHYQYDALGRVWREKKRMPGGSWSIRESTYTNTNARHTVSEPATLVIPTGGTEYDFVPPHKTTYTGYDPFGRPGTVTSPDGKATTYAYVGEASLTRTVDVNGGLGEAPVKTRELYDRQGRLRAVIEAADTPEAVTTTYTYDVGGRLWTVAMPGAAGTQMRTFKYDRSGLLEYQELPELGVSGNGRTTYSNYDARGHARRQITGTTNGAFDITIGYDNAERIETIKRTGTNETLKIFDYDDPTGAAYPQCANNRCNGKLAAAARYNYFSDLGTVVVTESYQYDAASGRPVRRDQVVGSTAAFTGDSFMFSQSYNDLGAVAGLRHPCRTDAATNCIGTQRNVTFGYSDGLLSSVSGFASSIAYHPNGTVKTVLHANNVTDTMTADPRGMQRTCSIMASGGGTTVVSDASDPCGQRLSGTAGVSWTTGAYEYDGAQNVKRIGGATYVYDPFHRLASWTNAPTSGAYTTTGFSYDTWGNMLFQTEQGCSAPINGQRFCYNSTIAAAEVSGTTNHYAANLYDEAGNVVLDPFQRSYAFDPVGRLRTSSADGREFRYIYTPDEERIAFVERVNSGGVLRNRTYFTLRGFEGQLLSSWRDDWTSGTRVNTWLEDEIFRGSLLLARVTPSGTQHYTLDHLGSPRVVSNAAGQLVGTQTFDPFGGGGTSNGGLLQFTGQERDSATMGGNVDLPDNFHARFYDKTGRFLSVDPVLDAETAAAFPQGWNRYVYAMNNPLRFVDPTGQIISLAALTEEQRQKLLESLNAFTGNTYGVDADMNLVLLEYGTAPSATASQFLGDAMSVSDVYRVEGVEGDRNIRFARANPQENWIKIDFKDFTEMDYGAFDPRTFSIGSNLIHELVHTHNDIEDPSGGEELKITGPVVDYVNRIRAERGMQLRGPMYTGTENGSTVSVPFIIRRKNAFLRVLLGDRGVIRGRNF